MLLGAAIGAGLATFGYVFGGGFDGSNTWHEFFIFVGLLAAIGATAGALA